MAMQAGDAVIVVVDGRRLRGHVALASDDGRAIIVTFQGVVDGCDGAIALDWSTDCGGFCHLATGRAIDVEPAIRHVAS